MIDKIGWGLAITLMFSMCSEKNKTTEQSKAPDVKLKSFKSVYDSLDQMAIPITFRPDEWNELYKKHLQKYGIKEGWEMMKHPYAKLVDAANYKAIIFMSTDEMGSPTLITIDRMSNPIDTLFLLGDWASNDPGNTTIELATINKDFTIHLLDSISTYDLGPDGDRLEGTRKLNVSDELYRVLDSGVIEKIR